MVVISIAKSDWPSTDRLNYRRPIYDSRLKNSQFSKDSQIRFCFYVPRIELVFRH